MIAPALLGIWAATVPVTSPYRWVPANPVSQAHYFLVVAKGSDGTIRAFIRNPEFNAGATFGTKDNLAYALRADGTIAVSNVPERNDPVTFHRATAGDLRWFYPSPHATWTYRQPADMHDGWVTARLTDVGMQLEPLAPVMRGIASDRAPSVRSPYIQSLAIARHGKLVLDDYFYGFTAQTAHDMRSAAKSVTTLIVGRAVADSQRISPDTRVLDALPDYLPVMHDDARKRAVTVGNLMTMASGLACDDNDDASPGNEDVMQSRPQGTDWYRYTLDLPMASAPGTRAVYCTAGINLLGAIVSRAVRRPLTSYFEERFARPLGFQNYALWLMPAPANEAYMGGGDYFRPRDFLKFGQLMLDGGKWKGRPIVAESWVRESIQPRTEPVGEGDRYGYGWHIQRLTVDGTSYDVANAGGNGGQLLIVVPSLDLTVMVTAGNYNQYPVWRTFLPAVTAAAIRSCAPV